MSAAPDKRPPSAKSLFKATKAKPKRDARQMEIADFPEAPAPKPPAIRREHDFYPTGQPEAIRALLSVDGERMRQIGNIWEPAVGNGAMAREIIASGFNCIGSDLVDRGWPGAIIKSFYEFGDAPAPVMITNPPFSEINARDGHGRWLKHSLSLPSWRYLALLLSWDWPAAKANGLGELLDRSPFSYCYLCRWKMDFTGEGSPPQRNAWFVWDRDWTASEPAFRWLDRVDNRQPKLAGLER